jgi:hypothetical protein
VQTKDFGSVAIVGRGFEPTILQSNLGFCIAFEQIHRDASQDREVLRGAVHARDTGLYRTPCRATSVSNSQFANGSAPRRLNVQERSYSECGSRLRVWRRLASAKVSGSATSVKTRRPTPPRQARSSGAEACGPRRSGASGIRCSPWRSCRACRSPVHRACCPATGGRARAA